MTNVDELLGYKKSFHRNESFFSVVRLGLEPRLFCTKNRRVASYTIGHFPVLSGLSRFEIANIELYLFNSNNLKKKLSLKCER